MRLQAPSGALLLLLLAAAAAVGLAQLHTCPVLLTRKVPLKTVTAGSGITTTLKVTNPGSRPVVVNVGISLPDNVCATKNGTLLSVGHIVRIRCLSTFTSHLRRLPLSPIPPRRRSCPQQEEWLGQEWGGVCGQPARFLGGRTHCSRQVALLQGQRAGVGQLPDHHDQHLDLRLHAR